MRAPLFRKFAGLFLSALLVGGAVTAMLNAQLIRDTISYYQYEPNDTIAAFAQQTGMNDNGTFLFYVSHPSLETAENFSAICDKTEHAAAVLGCYDGQKIYIKDITDPRLAGIRPTTAAHEMLHAAYLRLSDEDRKSVGVLLEAEYAKLKNSTELSERMALYAETQPGDRANELHSILGTELETLSPDLEEYYRRYFLNRQKVVAQHNQYQSLFDELRSRAEQLKNQINSLTESVEAKQRNYENQRSVLQADIEAFKRRNDDGEFTNQSEFDTQKLSLMNRQSALGSLGTEIVNDINYLNSLVSEYNSIVTETNTLNHSLDSSLVSTPKL